MSVLGLIGLVLLVVGGVGVLYTLFLALIPRRGSTGPTDSSAKVAVLIPAHNEERPLGDLLSDLMKQTRPPVVVTVILDHCTDATETVAREAGAVVFHLPDDQHGKPRALVRGFEVLQNREWDAVLVVDADCRMATTFLADCEPKSGEVVQSRVSLRAKPGQEPAVYEFLSRLENEWFHGGRDRLGLPGFLRGTGMFLGRKALARCSWESSSLTEDREQGFRFLRSGIPVRHESRAEVVTSPPSGMGESWSQRRRWTSVGIPAHLAAAAATAWRSFSVFGIRVWELPLATLADARSQCVFLIVAGTLLMGISGGPLWPGLGILLLTIGAGGIAGFSWYGRRFLGLVARFPHGAVVALGGAFLALLGKRPRGWGNGVEG